MTDSKHILAVIPVSWGDEAISMALGAAQRVGAPAGVAFSALLLGADDCPDAVTRASESGAKSILVAKHDELKQEDNLAALAVAAAHAVSLMAQCGLILVPPGPDGEELASRLAFLLAAQPLGRCTELRWLDHGFEVERATWGGKMRMALRLENTAAVACLRLGKAGPVEGAACADVEHIQIDIQLPRALPVEQTLSDQRLPPVENARIVVSGGRGVNQQGFAMLEELAIKLSGTLGGSLPAVDAGMVPVGRQVGVSGKFVSPSVYLAVGISGTAQHLAGISTDTCIVAINKDPDADIFKVANMGVVGEWEALLPALLKQNSA